MATVPKGYVFWDVSANKSYAAGKTFPALGNGDYLVPATTSADGYYQQYYYYTSKTAGGVTYTNCWDGLVQSAYTARAQKLPFNTIADKPVRFFSYSGCQFTSCPTTTNTGGTSSLSAITNLRHVSFYDCTKLTTAPALPTALTSLYFSFSGTKITSPPSNFASLSVLQNANYCFYNCKSLTSVPNISGLTALTSAVGMFYECTAINTPPVLPANLLDVGYMFYGCTSLTTGATVPSKVTSTYGMYWNCTALKGNIRIESDVIANDRYMLRNTSVANQIILLGPTAIYSDLKSIAATANNGNAYAGVVPAPNSFTAIRGTYDPTHGTFEERVDGTDCKLTITFTLPDVADGLLYASDMLPVLLQTIAGVETDISSTTAWRLNSVAGTLLSDTDGRIDSICPRSTNSRGQYQYTGTLVAVTSLASESTAAKYSLQLKSRYVYDSRTYNYHAGTKSVTLTEGNLILDANPTGTAFGFGQEAPDNGRGFYFNGPVKTGALDVTGGINASGSIYGAIQSQSITSFESGWQQYPDYYPVKVKKFGRVVHLTGAVSNIAARTVNATLQPVFTLPEEFRPADHMVELCQGSGMNIFMVDITTAGVVSVARYRAPNSTSYPSVVAGSWFPFNVTWIV